MKTKTWIDAVVKMFFKILFQGTQLTKHNWRKKDGNKKTASIKQEKSLAGKPARHCYLIELN
ncbi:MAG: hypothetical protein OEZ51_14440 [Nitrospinota bacterium]|nr:hypothetical protein [Nitrospinota bacterium]